ncbi:MAG: iron ABC transporter permease [Paludibacteraceae bacterium]|nr:iron ABC transporter permease [Paludibacteraceae bacterium]
MMKGTKHSTLIWVALGILLIGLAIVDVCCGAVWISPREIMASWSAISTESAIIDRIFFYLRLPKMLTAILAGVALSVSGMMMQTLFRNPLAGPYILGVSSGACLGVAVVTMLQVAGGGLQIASGSIAAAAIIGSIAVLMMMLPVARKVKDNVSLLIIGMMFGAVAGALVNVMQNISNPDSLKVFITWTLGSLSNVGWGELAVMSAIIIIGMIIVITMMKPLNGLLLGETYAQGLGINVQRVRTWIVVATGLLAGAVTAFCGPIAFVGVAVPHIARGLMRTSNHRIIIPASALIGANLLLACDIICSLSTYPLPISTMSALFGAPIIIGIIIKNK